MEKTNQFKKLSVLIPAYNEEKTITKILQAITDLDITIKKEIFVIDDGSKDNTLSIANEFKRKNQNKNIDFKIIKNKENLGKTQTVKKGISESTGDLVVIQDADLEYEPKDLITFVKAFEENPSIDFIYGNRFAKNFDNKYLTFYLGNRFVTAVSNFFTMFRGLRVGDMETCYKMAKGEIFREIGKTIESKSVFGLEPEVTAKFARYKKSNGEKLKFHQIPIIYRPRSLEEGKKMKYSEGFKAICEIIKFNIFKA